MWNAKQLLSVLGGVVVIAVFAYFSARGSGIEPDEVPRLLTMTGIAVAVTLLFVWVFRDRY